MPSHPSHPSTISSSAALFSSCLQSFSASGPFPMTWFFISSGQSIGTTASASVLPVSIQDFLGSSDRRESDPNAGDSTFKSWVAKILWRRKWQLTPVFLPGKFHAQKSLTGYSSWNCKESDMTEQLTHNTYIISFRIDWFDLLAVQGTLKSLLLQHNWRTLILRRSAFFMVQLAQPYVTTGKTITLTIWTFSSKVMFLIFNTLSTFVIAYLPSKCLLISCLQSPSAVILKPKKIKFVMNSAFSPSIFHEVMGLDATILVF